MWKGLFLAFCRILNVTPQEIDILFNCNFPYFNCSEFFLDLRSPKRATTDDTSKRAGGEAREEKDQVKSHLYRIFVGRLSRNVAKDHVQEIFSTYGTIKHVDMPCDSIHPVFNKGFAYVEYEKQEDANNACKFMDGGQIDGQEVKVSIAQPPPPPKPRNDADRNDRDRDRDRDRRDNNREAGGRGGRHNSPRRERSPPRRDRPRSPDRDRDGRRGGGGGASSYGNGRRRSRSPISRRSRSPRNSGAAAAPSGRSRRNRSSSSSSSSSSSDSSNWSLSIVSFAFTNILF